jgi:hypothetical protein
VTTGHGVQLEPCPGPDEPGEQITLHPTGSAPLTFRGELLAKEDTHDERSTRWHEVEVYRLDDGRHAVLARYRTQWQGEADETRVDEAGDVTGIESVLCDLREEILLPVPSGYPVRPTSTGEDPMAAKQARLLADLRGRFDRLITRVLRAIPGTARPL